MLLAGSPDITPCTAASTPHPKLCERCLGDIRVGLKRSSNNRYTCANTAAKCRKSCPPWIPHNVTQRLNRRGRFGAPFGTASPKLPKFFGNTLGLRGQFRNRRVLGEKGYTFKILPVIRISGVGSYQPEQCNWVRSGEVQRQEAWRGR